MRTTIVLATFVASALAICAAIGHAQQGGGRPAPANCSVAVIDVPYIFKKHNTLNANIARLKQEMQAADAAVRKDGDNIKAMVEQLKALKAGTPDYHKLEEKITTVQAQAQAHMNLTKKDFVERQAKLYYTTFQEVTDAVRYYADRNGISLVIQYSAEPVDPNNPQSIMNQLSGPVVYQHGVDITMIILDDLNRPNRPGQAPTANRPAGAGSFQK